MQQIITQEGETDIPYSDEIARTLEGVANTAGITVRDMVLKQKIQYESAIDRLNTSARRQGRYYTRQPSSQRETLCTSASGYSGFYLDWRLQSIEVLRESSYQTGDYKGLLTSIRRLEGTARDLERSKDFSEIDIHRILNTFLGHESIAWRLFAEEPNIEQQVIKVRLLNTAIAASAMLENSVNHADLSNYPPALRHATSVSVTSTATDWARMLGLAMEGYLDAKALGRSDLPWFAEGVGRVIRNLRGAGRLNFKSATTYTTSWDVARNAGVIPPSRSRIRQLRSAMKKYVLLIDK